MTELAMTCLSCRRVFSFPPDAEPCECPFCGAAHVRPDSRVLEAGNLRRAAEVTGSADPAHHSVQGPPQRNPADAVAAAAPETTAPAAAAVPDVSTPPEIPGPAAQEPLHVPFAADDASRPVSVPYWVPIEHSRAAEAAHNFVSIPAAHETPPLQDAPPEPPAELPGIPVPPPVIRPEQQNLVDVPGPPPGTPPPRKPARLRRRLLTAAAALLLLLAAVLLISGSVRREPSAAAPPGTAFPQAASVRA